jgi:hypothetical protein
MTIAAALLTGRCAAALATARYWWRARRAEARAARVFARTVNPLKVLPDSDVFAWPLASSMGVAAPQQFRHEHCFVDGAGTNAGAHG